MTDKMKIVVTGGSGFVGTHLIKRLRQLDHEVLNLDIKQHMDITDWERIKRIERFDLLYHLAAKIYVPESYENPHNFYYTNVNGTLNVLELCRRHNSKIIFASSYVYGHPRYLPIDEKHPLEGFNPYAQSKMIGEILCEGYNRDFNLPVIIVRPFNIYGPGQNSVFLIPWMIQQARCGQVILKDPRPKRDYVYIDDIIDVYIRCAEYRATPFEVFNIGAGKSHSVREIAETVGRQFNHDISVAYTDESRKNEVMDTVADISKAKKILGWVPTIDFEEGIKKTVMFSK